MESAPQIQSLQKETEDLKTQIKKYKYENHELTQKVNSETHDKSKIQYEYNTLTTKYQALKSMHEIRKI